jgi:hypothetical protein
MHTASFGSPVRNVLLLIITYATTFVAVQATQRFVTEESLAPIASMMLVQIVALAIARRVGARAAGYVVGCFSSTLLGEFVIQAIYGVKSIHSAPVHYAVLLAAALGIGVGALVTREPSTNRGASDASPAAVR